MENKEVIIKNCNLIETGRKGFFSFDVREVRIVMKDGRILKSWSMKRVKDDIEKSLDKNGFDIKARLKEVQK